MVERLERRRLFADILIEGTEGDDVIDLNANNFFINGSPDTYAGPIGKVDNIIVNGLGGSDVITFNAPPTGSGFLIVIQLSGGPGQDILRYNSTLNFRHFLSGGADNDTLVGGASGFLDGGEGSDRLQGSGDTTFQFADALAPQTDTIVDTSGTGIISFREMTQSVTVDLGSTLLATHTNRTVIAAPGTVLQSIEDSRGDDLLIGNNLPNSIDSSEGNDTLVGLGGDDRFEGSFDGGLIFGGDGGDTFFSSNAATTLFGGAGADKFFNDAVIFADADSEIFVESDGGTVNDGSTTPSLANFTDFGTIAPGGSVSRTFIVFNDGDAPLITANLRVTDASGNATSRFQVTEGLNRVIQPGQSDSFTIRFSTTTVGVSNAFVRFSNNDSTEAPYDFAIRGTVQNSTGAPEAEVRGNNVVIADGDTTPSTTDFTNFGTKSSAGFVDRVFTLFNTGTAPLTTSGLKIVDSAGAVTNRWSIVEGLSASIAPGGSDTFTVRFVQTATGSATRFITFATNDSNENPYNFAISGNVSSTGGGGTPEVDVQGNGVSITDGDTTPTVTDFTDFGSVAVNGVLTRTFTVRNTGTGTLTTSGLKVTQTNGSSTTAFTITEPLAASIPAGGSDTFTVQFKNATAGSFTRLLSFANNDSNENPYNFYVKGTAATAPTGAPEIEVRGNNISITDGDTTPSTTDFTDFGTKSSSGFVDRTFTVRNIGTSALTLSGLKIVDSAGVVTNRWSIIEGLTGSIAAGGSDTFTVRFVQTASGSATRFITFTTNDSNENPFNFAIKGNVA